MTGAVIYMLIDALQEKLPGLALGLQTSERPSGNWRMAARYKGKSARVLWSPPLHRFELTANGERYTAHDLTEVVHWLRAQLDPRYGESPDA